MQAKDVPQDKSSTYAGHKKLVYAKNEDGRYLGVQSSGWDIEAQATMDAVVQYELWAAEARAAVVAGTKSTLFFHMYDCRMDLPLLSQVAGIWRWRVKRHFKPRNFERLSASVLQRYAQALDITVDELKKLPEKSSV